METAHRLKTYIDYLGLTSSQFADMASIPRPTLSQLLTGRNKSISTDLVSKIHEAFPELNIAWLLFSEGDMVNDANIQFSTAQNAEIENQNTNLFSKNQLLTEEINDDFISQTVESNREPAHSSRDTEPTMPYSGSHANTEFPKAENMSESISNNFNRRIKQIMVLYDDGKYEIYTP